MLIETICLSFTFVEKSIINIYLQFLEKKYRNMQKMFSDIKVFWTEMRDNPFKWQLFKSITYFVFGLKLFSDLARNMADTNKHLSS